jgi:outer membrane protein assembly factor BamB
MRAHFLAASFVFLAVLALLAPDATRGQDKAPLPPAAGPKDVLPFGPALLLPADSSLTRKVQAVRDFVSAKQWDEAAKVLQDLLDRPEDVFLPVTRRGPDGEEITSAVSLRAEIDRLLAGLPRPGHEAYEAVVGKRASQALAAAQGQPAALGAVVRRFPHTRAGTDAAVLLGTHHLDRGHFDIAAAYFDRALRSADEKLDPQTLFQAALAFRRAGDRDRAEQVWKRLTSAAPDGINSGGRTIPLDDLEKSLARAAGPASEVPVEALISEANWRQETLSAGPSAAWVSEAVRRLEAGSQPILPSTIPLVVGDKIVSRSLRGIRAVDLKSGRTAWESHSPLALDNLARDPAAHGHVGLWLESYLVGQPGLLLENTVLGSLSSDGRRVYAIDDLPVPPRPLNYAGFHSNQGQGLVLTDAPALTDAVYHSKLLAIDAGSGKVAWELGGPHSPAQLRDCYFLGPPLPLGGKLYAPVEIGFDLRLLCLEPLTGEVVWTQTLATFKSRLAIDGGRRLHAARLVYGDGFLVCPTQAGGVVAFDLVGRSLAWAHVYREEPPPEPVPFQTRRRPRGRFVTDPPNLTSEWKVSAPVIVAGKVVFAAPDAPELRCLDLRDGSLVWQVRRAEGDLFLAGATDDRVVIVARGEVRAINLTDGKPLWRCETPAPAGRGAAAGGIYRLPVRGTDGKAEVLSIDLVRGAVTSRTAVREREAPSPLVAEDVMPKVSDLTATRIASLVSQLGSDRPATREAANRVLEAAGAAALEVLGRAATSEDPEVRRRVAPLIRGIEKRQESAQLIEPQRLRLQYKDTPLAEAVADFSKRSGMTLKLPPELMKDGDRKITLDTGTIPLWEALDQFCAKAGLAEVPPVPDSAPAGGSGNSITISGVRGGPTQTDVLRTATAEKPPELILADGKGTPRPTSDAGALRVRVASAEAAAQQKKEDGEILVPLDVAIAGRLHWQKAVGLRIEKALDEDGHLLSQLPTSFKPPVSTAVVRGNVMINGMPVVPPVDEPEGAAARLVPVRLKRVGDKSPKKLTELSGTIVAQVRTGHEPLVTVDNVMKAAGRTIKGRLGGEVKVIEVAEEDDGQVRLKVRVERVGRGTADVPVNPFGGTVIINGRRLGEEDLLSSLDFSLLDQKGKPFVTVKAISTGVQAGAAHEYELVYKPETEQGEAAKFVYSDRRTLFIDVPFTLKDVVLP